MAAPGRNCPLHYRYDATVLAQGDPLEADVLYIVGGLYGNPYALDSVLESAAREHGRTRVIFNGDFHWFDIDAALFADIDRRVMQHHATRGNVETELAAASIEAGSQAGRQAVSEAGCGCGYPDWVGDDEVSRSNQIMQSLCRVAAALPGLADKYQALPMTLCARVGDVRIAILHGDAESLAGWSFSQENLLSAPAHAARLLGQVGADVIACTHTCLPVAQQFETARGPRLAFNNGAAGMPNFKGDARGLVTRVALTASPAALYGASVRGVHIEALPVDCGGARWLDTFDDLWPSGSPASISYRRRIRSGPAYQLVQAVRRGVALSVTRHPK